MSSKVTRPLSRTRGTTESPDSSANLAVVVLGFFHSGLPTLTGILERLGVHVDSLPFQRLNKRLLEANGSEWLKPPIEGVDSNRLAGQFDQPITDQVQRHTDHLMWGWVDPVNMLTLPVYRQNFINRRQPYKIIYIARELEITAKLLAVSESGMSVAYARILAQAYRQWATKALHQEPDKSRWWLIDYEQLATDRDTVTHELHTFLRE